MKYTLILLLLTQTTLLSNYHQTLDIYIGYNVRITVVRDKNK
nr:hypothetical protein [Sulfurimonas sp. SAG-AH-194-C20]